MVVGARLSVSRHDPCDLGERLQPTTVALAKHGEQSQDKVGLGERCTAAVDAQKNLGDALLINLMTDLHSLERVVCESDEAAQRITYRLLAAVCKRLRSAAAQALQE